MALCPKHGQKLAAQTKKSTCSGAAARQGQPQAAAGLGLEYGVRQGSCLPSQLSDQEERGGRAGGPGGISSVV